MIQINPDQIAEGQKIVVYCILINLTIFLQWAFYPSAYILLLSILTIPFILIGQYKLSTGLGHSSLKKAIYFGVLFLFPLFGIIMLLILNSRATDILRANGYKVGLLGTKK